MSKSRSDYTNLDEMLRSEIQPKPDYLARIFTALTLGSAVVLGAAAYFSGEEPKTRSDASHISSPQASPNQTTQSPSPK